MSHYKRKAYLSALLTNRERLSRIDTQDILEFKINQYQSKKQKQKKKKVNSGSFFWPLVWI